MRWRAKRVVLAGLAILGNALGQESTRPISEALSTAPDACFDGNSLAESIATWLGKREVSTRVSILVRRPTADSVRFTVERDAKLGGERDLPVGKLACPDLRAALSLAIAIAIDSTILESLGVEAPPTTPTERETELVPTSPPVTPAPVATPPEKDEPPPPRKRLRPREEAAKVAFAAEAVALFGVLPGPALGAAPRLGFAPISWLDLRASALGTTRAQTIIGGGTTSASLLAGHGEVCALGRIDEVRSGGCVGGAVGSFAAEGSGLRPAYSPSVRWAALTARLEARYPASSVLALLVGVTGFVPVLRPELQVVDSNGKTVDSWKAPRVGFGVSLGGELTVW